MTSAEKISNDINQFLISQEATFEMRFGHGYFIKLKKHIRSGKPFIEIHTSGFDDTLPADEAVDWLKWELIDREANGCFEL